MGIERYLGEIDDHRHLAAWQLSSVESELGARGVAYRVEVDEGVARAVLVLDALDRAILFERRVDLRSRSVSGAARG